MSADTASPFHALTTSAVDTSQVDNSYQYALAGASQINKWTNPSGRGMAERVLGGSLAGGLGYGFPGGWLYDRREQVLHFRHWVFIAVSTICKNIAKLSPNVAYVSNEEEEPPPASRVQKEMLARYRKSRQEKSLNAIRPHEEVQPLSANHPLMRLFARPNAWDTSYDLWYELIMFLELTGNAYLWVVPSVYGSLTGTGQAAELMVLPSHWMREKWGPNGLEHYWMQPFMGGGMLRFPPHEIIKFKWKSPVQKVDGHSPQQAGSEWIDASESIDLCTYFSFKNGCFPTGHFELSPAYGDLDDTELDRAYAKLFSRFQGESRYGLPLITPAGVKFNPLQIQNSEMAYRESRQDLRDATLALWGVPKESAGVQDAGTETAVYGPMKQLAEVVLAPRLRYIGEVLTRHLAGRWDERIRVWWDNPSTDSPEDRIKNIEALARNTAISVNEIRAEFGYQPWEHGEDPMSSHTGLPLPLATGKPLDPTITQAAAPPQPGGGMGGAPGLPGVGQGESAPGEGASNPSNGVPGTEGIANPGGGGGAGGEEEGVDDALESLSALLEAGGTSVTKDWLARVIKKPEDWTQHQGRHGSTYWLHVGATDVAANRRYGDRPGGQGGGKPEEDVHLSAGEVKPKPTREERVAQWREVRKDPQKIEDAIKKLSNAINTMVPNTAALHALEREGPDSANGKRLHALQEGQRVLMAWRDEHKQGKSPTSSATPTATPEAKPAEVAPTPATPPAEAPKPEAGEVKGNKFKLDKGLHPEAVKVVQSLAKNLQKNKTLSLEQKHAYMGHAQSVIQQMTPQALARFQAGAKGGAEFHADTGALKQSLFGQTGGPQGEVGGAYKRSAGQLYLDGDPQGQAEQHAQGAKGVYAHEFTHAIDGPAHEISQSPEWQKAFAEELQGGQLTKYGAAKPSEGLAEFGRMMLGEKHDADTLAVIQSTFPQCYAVWEKHGLVNQVPPAEPGVVVHSPVPEEIFGERVELPGGEGHADILAQPAAATGTPPAEQPGAPAPAPEAPVTPPPGAEAAQAPATPAAGAPAPSVEPTAASAPEPKVEAPAEPPAAEPSQPELAAPAAGSVAERIAAVPEGKRTGLWDALREEIGKDPGALNEADRKAVLDMLGSEGTVPIYANGQRTNGITTPEDVFAKTPPRGGATSPEQTASPTAPAAPAPTAASKPDKAPPTDMHSQAVAGRAASNAAQAAYFAAHAAAKKSPSPANQQAAEEAMEGWRVADLKARDLESKYYSAAYAERHAPGKLTVDEQGADGAAGDPHLAGRIQAYADKLPSEPAPTAASKPAEPAPAADGQLAAMPAGEQPTEPSKPAGQLATEPATAPEPAAGSQQVAGAPVASEPEVAPAQQDAETTAAETPVADAANTQMATPEGPPSSPAASGADYGEWKKKLAASRAARDAARTAKKTPSSTGQPPAAGQTTEPQAPTPATPAVNQQVAGGEPSAPKAEPTPSAPAASPPAPPPAAGEPAGKPPAVSSKPAGKKPAPKKVEAAPTPAADKQPAGEQAGQATPAGEQAAVSGEGVKAPEPAAPTPAQTQPTGPPVAETERRRIADKKRLADIQALQAKEELARRAKQEVEPLPPAPGAQAPAESPPTTPEGGEPEPTPEPALPSPQKQEQQVEQAEQTVDGHDALIQHKDEATRDKLVTDHLGLAYAAARRHKDSANDVENLEGEALKGLVIAANKYDPNNKDKDGKTIPFAAFAAGTWINNLVGRQKVADKGPVRTMQRPNQGAATYSALLASGKTPEEAGKEMGWADPETGHVTIPGPVQAALANKSGGQESAEGEGTSLADVAVDRGAGAVDVASQSETHQRLHDAIQELTDSGAVNQKAADILRLKFGIGHRPIDGPEIATRLGMFNKAGEPDKAAVSRIYLAAVKELRQNKTMRPLLQDMAEEMNTTWDDEQVRQAEAAKQAKLEQAAKKKKKDAPVWVAKAWVRDPGPRSSRRWRNTVSGHTIYADAPPPDGGGATKPGAASQGGATTTPGGGGGLDEEVSQGVGGTGAGLPARAAGQAGPATQLLEEVWAGLRAEQKLLNAGASPVKLPNGYPERAEVLRKAAHALHQRILDEAEWKLGQGEGLEAIRHHQDVLLRHYLAHFLDHKEAEKKTTSPVGDVPEVTKGMGPHKFASTHFHLPEALTAKILNFGLGIPDEELAEGGREEEVHLTSRYGLHGESADEVRRVVEGLGPVQATLGLVGVFPAKGGVTVSGVLCHVDGPSGSGKTTLAERLRVAHPELSVRDLDDFDDAAVAILGWVEKPKDDYTDEMLTTLADKRQLLMDEFLKEENQPVVLVGHGREGDIALTIQTAKKFLLDVDAETSARRALERSQTEAAKFRRTEDELSGDIQEAQDDIDWLRYHGYESASADDVAQWVAAQLATDSGHDVVYIAVDSPDMHALHDALGDLPHTQTHAGYTPHVTLGYLAPGAGEKYIGDDTFAGETVTLSELIFSAPDSHREVIDLGADAPDFVAKGQDDLRRVALRRIGARLRAHKDPAPMPGYGKIYLLGDHVWYVGGDGDEDGFLKIVETKLSSVPGVSQVTYASESFPPRGEGWKQVYPPEEGGWRDKIS